MNITELLLAAGNFLLLVAAYPQIKTAWINRKSLVGFSKNGAGLTLMGVLLIWGAYIQMGSVVNILLLLPTILFWGLITKATRDGD